jgi:hypothetical protein
LENGGRNALPSYEPNYVPRAKIRVEVHFPLRYVPAYQFHLCWLVAELTRLRGGCTVQENLTGLYQSSENKPIEDRVSVVYSDFDMDWSEPAQRAEALAYCATLKQFLKENLWEEEEILISAYPVAHVSP